MGKNDNTRPFVGSDLDDEVISSPERESDIENDENKMDVDNDEDLHAIQDWAMLILVPLRNSM